MMLVQKNITGKLFLFLAILLIAGCASQLPPGGGDIDKTPPEIINVIPKPGVLNYSDNFFEISFSEYVEKRSVQEAIFVSPPLSKSLKYDWSGRTLTAYFQDSLKQNTTYTITIGADVEDLNNRNKMAEPFTFAFSTGAKLDSGKISGKIFDSDPSGSMVFAYLKKNDEINPSVHKPDYVSQVGKNGKYTLVGLSEGEYKVFAFRDRLKDFLYQIGEDEFGVQFKEIKITSGQNEMVNCDFILSKQDTIPPKLSSVIMKDRNHFLLEYNEPVDSSKISASNFYLFDSTKQSRIDVSYFFKGDARPGQFILAIKDSLVKGNIISLICTNIEDVYGNKNEYESYSITPKLDPDTVKPKLLKIAGTMPGDKVDYEDPILNVKFDDGFSKSGIESAITIEDAAGKKITHQVEFIDDASFKIKISGKLLQRTDYSLSIDLRKIIDIAGNKADSTFKQKITTNSELDFSGVSGKIKNTEENSELYVELKSVESSKKNYIHKVNKDKTFTITKILPGKYLLSSFIDKNKNGKYDSGSVKPFSFAERFTFYPDTLNLRARWPVVDLSIEY